MGDVAIYIKPSTGEHEEEGAANCGGGGGGGTANSGSSIRSSAASVRCGGAADPGSEEGSPSPASETVVEKKKFLDWIFETPDWRQLLLDNFWEFPGGNGGPTYTLEVEYEESKYSFLQFWKWIKLTPVQIIAFRSTSTTKESLSRWASLWRCSSHQRGIWSFDKCNYM